MAEFRTFADVEAWVRSHPDGLGRGLLGMQVAIGAFQNRNHDVAAAWLAEQEAQEQAAAQKARDEEARTFSKRTVEAAEKQANAAVLTNKIAWWAIGISLVSAVISVVALYRS
jgi:phage terminase Nu1 subunit (DNA packaging protein)